MNLSETSIILLSGLIIPNALFLYAIISTKKNRRNWNIYIQPVAFLLYTMISFFTYRVGLSYEISNQNSINFMAFTAAIKIYVGEFQGEIVPYATGNSYYATLLYTTSITGFLFVFYNLFGLILRKFSNNIRLRYYKNCSNLYIFGKDDKINTFLKSLENEPEFKWQFIRFFLPNYSKVIIVIPKSFAEDFLLVQSSIQPAFIYADIDKHILQRIINTKSTKPQKFISLYEDDNDNIKLINSASKLIHKDVVHFENLNTILKNDDKIYQKAMKLYIQSEYKTTDYRNNMAQESKALHTINPFKEIWLIYRRLDCQLSHGIRTLTEQEKILYNKIKILIEKYEKTHFNVKGIIHFVDLDALDMLEMNLSLKHCIQFYSQNALVAYQYVFNNPIVRYKMDGKKAVHYILVGFGLTNRNLLRYLLINNVTNHLKRRYSIISKADDKNNTFQHFKENINIECFKKKSNEDYLSQDHVNMEEIFGTLNYVLLDATTRDFKDYLAANSVHDDEQMLFIVALGNDLANIDVGHKILDFINFNNLQEQAKIDLRIIDDEMDVTPLFGNKNNIVNSFGKYEQVFTYSNIIRTDIMSLSKGAHESMNRFNSPWERISYSDKLSSMFLALSIRNKLLEMGLDLSVDKEVKAITAETYYKIYDSEKNREIWNDSSVQSIDKLKRYKIENQRQELAEIEHMRWNSFKILDGFVPMSIDTMKNNMKRNAELPKSERYNPAKDEEYKLHACITTYNGLIDLGKIILEENKKLGTNYLADYLLYDFMMMDKLPEILKQTKYSIINVRNTIKQQK